PPAPFAPKGKASLDRRPGANPLEPVFEARKVFKPLALVLVGYDPAPAGYISDRIAPGEVVAVLEAPLHDAIEPVHFVRVAPDRIRDLLLGVLAEVMGLARHGAKPSHLPEQPLVDLNSLALTRGVELSRLAPEI